MAKLHTSLEHHRCIHVFSCFGEVSVVISTISQKCKNVAPQKVYHVSEASKTVFLISYSTVSDKLGESCTLKGKGMRDKWLEQGLYPQQYTNCTP